MEKQFNLLVENYTNQNYQGFNKLGDVTKTQIKNLIFNFIKSLKGEYLVTDDNIPDIIMDSKIDLIKNIDLNNLKSNCAYHCDGEYVIYSK